MAGGHRNLAVNQLQRTGRDDLAFARKKYRATLEPADGRLLVHLNKAFVDSLSSLGFDPTARSRLGVAEVKAISAIDKLLAKREARK